MIEETGPRNEHDFADAEDVAKWLKKQRSSAHPAPARPTSDAPSVQARSNLDVWQRSTWGIV